MKIYFIRIDTELRFPKWAMASIIVTNIRASKTKGEYIVTVISAPFSRIRLTAEPIAVFVFFVSVGV